MSHANSTHNAHLYFQCSMVFKYCYYLSIIESLGELHFWNYLNIKYLLVYFDIIFLIFDYIFIINLEYSYSYFSVYYYLTFDMIAFIINLMLLEFQILCSYFIFCLLTFCSFCLRSFSFYLTSFAFAN